MTTTTQPALPASAPPDGGSSAQGVTEPRRHAQGDPLATPPEEWPRSLVDHIHRAVERWPDNEALRWKPPKAEAWESRSYRQMWEWVTDLSLGLAELGIGSGDAVCIVSRTRPEWVIADLASLATGAVSCPIYPQSEPNQAAFVINNVRARLVFVENAQQAAKVASVRGECPTVEHVVAFESQGKYPEGTLTLGDIVARARAHRDETALRRWEEGWQKIGHEQLATVIHTSGTTANPKGAMLAHGNILFNTAAAPQIVDLYPTDLFLAWLPLSHIFARLVDEYLALGLGATVTFAEPLIERLPANMAEVRPTLMAAVPRLYERVYSRVLSTVEAGPPLRQKIFHWAQGVGAQKYRNHVEERGDSPWLWLQSLIADLLVFRKIRARTGGRIRYFVSGSAPLASEIGEFFYAMGMLVLEGYGLTETSPFVSVNSPEDFRFGTVGRPAPGSEVRIDTETGEILVRGPQIMKGYLNQPEETAKAIDRDGWFHTGDIGELDEIGRIRITDRLKNIIVLANGKNVSPAPMEAALSTSRYIAQAVILGDRQPYTGALIAPDFEELEKWAAGQGITEMPPEKLVAEPRVEKLIDAEVKRTLDGWAVWERPRRVALLPRLLSEEEGELTPSLKTKLRVVQAKWADKIAYLFDEKAPDTAA